MVTFNELKEKVKVIKLKIKTRREFNFKSEEVIPINEEDYGKKEFKELREWLEVLFLYCPVPGIPVKIEGNSKNKKYCKIKNIEKKKTEFTLECMKRKDWKKLKNNFEKRMELSQELRKIGKHLRRSSLIPKPDPKILKKWHMLVEEWAEDNSIPLFIRKNGNKYKRGKEIEHETGRKIIPCDNSPAAWIMYKIYICKESNYKLEKIKKRWKEIPFKFTEVNKNKDMQILYSKYSIAHIEDIGLRRRRDIKEIDIEKLKEHFLKFLSPYNIVLIPKNSGFGEIPEIIDVFEEYMKKLWKKSNKNKEWQFRNLAEKRKKLINNKNILLNFKVIKF